MEYLDGELPAEERATFERHLAVCPDCQRYVDGYRKSVGLAQSATSHVGRAEDVQVPEALVKAILAARRAN
jgi:anti-sigma factor RsiW